MKQLLLLYWGCIGLMYLSQVYYPAEPQLNDSRAGNRHFMLRRADVFMVVVIAWMTCFSFLRTNYNDTFNYIKMFKNAPTLIEYITENGLALGGNRFSYIYQSWMRDLTDNYHIYFFFPALLSSYAVVKLFKRYSVNPAFSLLVFFSLGTYIMYLAALKQCLAMFFLLMGIPFLDRKKYISYYLCVLLAIMFHTHAFMFLFVPFMCEKPWGKRMWAVLFAAIFAMITYDSTLGAFMRFAESVGVFVSDEEVFDGHAINALRVLVYWIPAVLALVFRKRLFTNSTRLENVFVNLSCVSAFILTIGLVEGANLYARMAAYFEIFTAISLPWMIAKLFTARSAKLVTALSVVFYFGYFYYEFAFSKSFNTAYSAISLWQFLADLFH